MRAPPFGPFDDQVENANLAAINATKPDVLWVALGCPKQELWMQRYRRQADCAVILAVGAAFDFLAGMTPQAPARLQRLGLEWAFRLAAEPRRLWKRYLIRNPYFVCQFTLQWLKWRWRP
jgi:N-acetylglucosaminyldiphosphoundecaprenol N-acetyl-beta-D-mannosaminyltransferase